MIEKIKISKGKQKITVKNYKEEKYFYRKNTTPNALNHFRHMN